MPRDQARFSLATWRDHEISASRRVPVSEQSAQTCVEDRASGLTILIEMAKKYFNIKEMFGN